METPLAACLDLPGNGARKRAVDVGVENLCGVTFLRSPATAPEKELDGVYFTRSLGNPKRKV